MVSIAPSLLAADFSALAAEVRRVSGADMLHIDVMDGRFVPNLSVGPQVVASLRDKTSLPFDVHLMLEHPLPYIAPFRAAGADLITFHVESADDPAPVLQAIRESGARPGMAVSPDTPPKALLPWLSQLEMVTVMTVQPGFGGQKLLPEALGKIRWLKEKCPALRIEVDGGVNLETAPLCRAAGADILVAGTAVFHADDPSYAISALRG